MKKDFSALLFEVADTFSMEVRKRRNTSVGSLKGEARYELALMEGLHWEINPKIVDSAVHTDCDKVAALVHVTGMLYLLLVLDGAYTDRSNDHFATLWILDGAKLGWTKQTGFLVFPSTWNRAQLYEKVQEGVVAAFQRSRIGTKWTAIEDARGAMPRYLKRKEEERKHGPHLTDAERVVVRLQETMNAISETYRTKGPRGV